MRKLSSVPHTSYHGYSKQSSWKRPRNKFAQFTPYKRLIVSCLISILLITSLFGISRYFSIFSNLEASLWSSVAKLGLKLENVYVEGQHHTKSEKIIDALQVNIGQPIFNIPLEAIRERLEQLDWVKLAVVERQLPNTLHIRIIERQPLAFWQHQGKLYLIDGEGNVIREPNLKPFAQLKMMVGEDAPLHAERLLELLQTEPSLFKHLSAAIRVSERRWNLRFNNGLEIKLPEENLEKAWAFLLEQHRKENLLSGTMKVIDLRIPDKLFVEPSVPNFSLSLKHSNQKE